MPIDPVATAKKMTELDERRATLRQLLQAVETLGGTAHAPDDTVGELYHLRDDIAQLKAELKQLHIVRPDHPEDTLQFDHAVQAAVGSPFQERSHTPDPRPPDTARELSLGDRRVRQRLLAQVRASWIEGVLQSSLHQRTMFVIETDRRPELVRTHQGSPDRCNRPAATHRSDSTIDQLFDEAGGTLLIVGRPGAGKTTILLALAQTLITRAEQDEQHPIPLVLFLRPWSRQRTALDAWLVYELAEHYAVPTAIGKQLIERNMILPLLDGLDELPAEDREACVEAMNTFCQQRPVSLVVTSRDADYEPLHSRLAVGDAIQLRPLSDEQIRAYLAQADRPLLHIQEALERDHELRVFARSPLVLHVLLSAYGDRPLDDLIAARTDHDRYHRLFQTYAEQMFRRPNRIPDPAGEPAPQMRRWLASLAQLIEQSKAPLFLIERLQPELLPTPWHGVYIALVITVTVLIVSSVGALVSAWQNSVGAMVTAFLFAGPLFFAFAYRLLKTDPLANHQAASEEGTQAQTVLTRWKRLARVPVVEVVTWSSLEAIDGFLQAMLVLLVPGMLLFMVLPFFGLDTVSDPAYLFIVLLLPISFAVIRGLIPGEAPARARPNEGIWHSARMTAVLVPMAGLASLAVLLAGRLMLGDSAAELFLHFVGFGFLVGGLAAMARGGFAWVQHVVLRILFVWAGRLPLNMVCFLEGATERSFLHRVGGGYIFMHRMLQEYFLSLARDPAVHQDARASKDAR